MITLRKASARGHFAIDWLNSFHTFSFGEYHDEQHSGWGPLRVINDDTVAPKGGFAAHSHRDMEIISYVLEGELEHRDSLGTGSVIRPGEIQRMRAGSGIRHSEFNPSPSHAAHFLQIWIEPNALGLQPAYAQHAIPDDLVDNQFGLIAAPASEQGLVDIAADARLYLVRLEDGAGLTHHLGHPRAYLHVAKGEARLNEHALKAGDGAYLSDESDFVLSAETDAEILLFELAHV